MWDKPSINRLPGERLHLRHGPIGVILKVWAAPDVVRQAHRLVTRHFPKILPALGDELATLRRPSTGPAKFEGSVAQRMADAALLFVEAQAPKPLFVTPMAAVAGAVAEEVLRIVSAAGATERVLVDDGGDIAFHLTPGSELVFGSGGDFAEASAPYVDGRLTLTSDLAAGGIATSGALGRGFSLGIADSVTVLARSAALADVAASLVANAVTVESKAITRKPANKLDPETDLGEQLVTTKVGRLRSEEIEVALASGAALAEDLLDKGLILGAALILQGEIRTVGAPMAGLKAKRPH